MAATVLQFPYGARATPRNRRELQVLMKLALEGLAGLVDARQRDESLRELLDVMARLWKYSAFNQWCIHLQRGGAAMVAGRRAWERMGRNVRPAARPISIAAPSRRAGGGLRIHWVWVYDVRDTDGPPLAELDAMPQGETHHVATLERAAARLGIEVVEQVLPNGYAGCSFGGRIVVRPGLSPLAECRVLAHELAHELLHQAERARRSTLLAGLAPPRTQAEMETEADATAYVVLAALGLPSSSVDYIAWQGGSGAVILRSWRRVAGAARTILAATQMRPRAGRQAGTPLRKVGA